MKEWLVFITEYCVLAIDALALVVIVGGTIEAAFKIAALMFRSPNPYERREVWMQYARWLVAGLTFQLAADILETAIAPDWDDVGRLAVIAIVRTLLNYFLERDLAEFGRLQREDIAATGKPTGD